MASAKDIAVLERKLKEAKSNREKIVLAKELKDLKSKLSTTQKQDTLPTQRRKIRMLSSAEFKELIARLKQKPEYSFLKSMSSKKIQDDYRVVAKPVGWRIKGKHNYKVPSKKFRRENPDLVYYEARARHSDVHRPNRLEQGGNMDSLMTENIKKKWNEYVSENGRKNYASYESILKEIRSENRGGRGYTPSSGSSIEYNTLNLLKRLGVLYEVTDRRKPQKQRGYYLKNNEVADGGMMAEGGSVNKDGMRYFVLNEMSSGFIANHSNADTYAETNQIRKKMIEILRTHGDYTYSLAKAVDLVKKAEKLWKRDLSEKDEMANGGMMARGGYVSKGEMVWKKISDSQKMDFLYKNFTPEITPRSQEKLVGKSWNFLPKNVKIKFESKYANVEDYATGGSLKKKDSSVKSTLADAKKRVARMTDDEVVEEISTIYHYEMQDNDVDMEELYDDIATARKELAKHYAEQSDNSSYARGGNMKKITAYDIENGIGRKFRTEFGQTLEIIDVFDRSGHTMVKMMMNGQQDTGKIENVVEFLNLYGQKMARGGGVKKKVKSQPAPTPNANVNPMDSYNVELVESQGKDDKGTYFMFPKPANDNSRGILFEKGGEIVVGDWVAEKKGTARGKVYQDTGVFIKLEDKYGNKSTTLYSKSKFKKSVKPRY